MRILKILAISTIFGALGAAAEPFTIGVSLLTQQHPFYVALADAMKEEARKDGVKLDIAIANQDLNKQVSDVEDFISKHVNAIILSPVDSRGVKAAVGKAQKAGIPLITVDIAANGVDVTCHVATDNYAGGVKAGELMAKVLGGKGKVGIIDYPTVQSVIDRVAGFKKALSAYSKYENRLDPARDNQSRGANCGTEYVAGESRPGWHFWLRRRRRASCTGSGEVSRQGQSGEDYRLRWHAGGPHRG